MSRTIPQKMYESRSTGQEITVEVPGYGLVTFDPQGIKDYISNSSSPVVLSVNSQTGDVVITADDVDAVAVPETPATYSIDPEDIAAVLVAAGLMAPEA